MFSGGTESELGVVDKTQCTEPPTAASLLTGLAMFGSYRQTLTCHTITYQLLAGHRPPLQSQRSGSTVAERQQQQQQDY
jgi:hypothetical protein